MRSKRNRHKCKDRRDYDRTRRKFYGFVYRLHNGCLKVQEAKALRYELRGRNEWLKFCYDPLVYISQEDIDRHFENTIWEKDDYPFNCIEVWVDDPFASPYGGNGAVRHNAWLISEPGYYRVSVTFETKAKSNTKRTHYTMKHYNGMPYFNYHNDRNYNNYVSRAYHQVLKHYSEIEESILKKKREIEESIRWEKREMEYRKACTYNRLKNARILKMITARQKVREQSNRVRGVTPTKETIAFFQALAIGSAIKDKVA